MYLALFRGIGADLRAACSHKHKHKVRPWLFVSKRRDEFSRHEERLNPRRDAVSPRVQR